MAAIWLICDIIAVWLALSWLIAFAIDSGTVVVCAPVRVLPVVIAAALRVVVVPPVAVIASSLLSSAAYILWVCGAYPICPAMFRNCCDRIRRVYAAAMNVLRAGYVLGVTASQSSNSFIGKMLACIKSHTALFITCTSEYGSRARTVISWHCSIRWNKALGASFGLNVLRKRVSLANSVIASGLP